MCKSEAIILVNNFTDDQYFIAITEHSSVNQNYIIKPLKSDRMVLFHPISSKPKISICAGAETDKAATSKIGVEPERPARPDWAAVEALCACYHSRSGFWDLKAP